MFRIRRHIVQVASHTIDYKDLYSRQVLGIQCGVDYRLQQERLLPWLDYYSNIVLFLFEGGGGTFFTHERILSKAVCNRTYKNNTHTTKKEAAFLAERTTHHLSFYFSTMTRG
jgi:hypothetical protein